MWFFYGNVVKTTIVKFLVFTTILQLFREGYFGKLILVLVHIKVSRLRNHLSSSVHGKVLILKIVQGKQNDI